MKTHSKKTAPKAPRTPPRTAAPLEPLPSLFALFASIALTGEGSSFRDHSEELAHALAIVRPMLTPLAMLQRDAHLSGAAWSYADRYEAHRMQEDAEDLLSKPPADLAGAVEVAQDIRSAGIWPGLYVGLAAGYLLARLDRELGGAR